MAITGLGAAMFASIQSRDRRIAESPSRRGWLIAGVAFLCVAAGGGGYAISQLSRGDAGPREPHVLAPAPRPEPAAAPASGTPPAAPADPPAPAPAPAAPTGDKPAAAADGTPATAPADDRPAGDLVDAKHPSASPMDTVHAVKPAGKPACCSHSPCWRCAGSWPSPPPCGKDETAQGQDE